MGRNTEIQEVICLMESVLAMMRAVKFPLELPKQRFD